MMVLSAPSLFRLIRHSAIVRGSTVVLQNDMSASVILLFFRKPSVLIVAACTEIRSDNGTLSLSNSERNEWPNVVSLLTAIAFNPQIISLAEWVLRILYIHGALNNCLDLVAASSSQNH